MAESDLMITVLRIGHRKKRDARISTHCGLVSRAFGARRIIYSGERDDELLDSVKDVVARWGGPFEAQYEKNWRKAIKQFKGIKVHLSMYGIPYERKVRQISKKRDVLVIIGSEKVPGEVYHAADFNLAVTNQPHSEVAALAVFLNALHAPPQRFTKAKLRIIPQPIGKNVISIR